MAKMLKQLVFGQKKNPPAPPRPDYSGNKTPSESFDNPPDSPFSYHDYENISKFKASGQSQVRFAEKKEPELVVFDNYSEPADLRAEISKLEEDDPLYMSPLDDQGTAPPLEPQQEEEEMYCVPYDTPEEETTPALPQPCLAPGYVSHKLGRKAVLMYISFSYTVSWLMIAYAPSMGYVFTGRFISGFCAGICFVAVPAYVVEISTVQIRGLLTAGFQVAFAFGVFLIMFFGIFLRWSWLAISGASVVAVGACLMVFMPESPPWLIRMGKNSQAFDGLRFLRGKYSNAAREFQEISEHIADEPKEGFSIRELLLPELYKPVVFAVALMLFQQFSGINALMSYAVELFENSKSFIEPSVAATIVALVQVVMTAFSSLLIDRAGRKILYIISGCCMTVSLVASGFYSYISEEFDASEMTYWSWVPLVCFVTYIAAFSVGLGPIPFVVTPELVPTHSRSFLLAVASVCSSLFSFIATKTFDDLRSAIGLYGVYWMYASFAFMGFFFYWIFIPETKGRTIQDIHRSFSVTKSDERL